MLGHCVGATPRARPAPTPCRSQRSRRGSQRSVCSRLKKGPLRKGVQSNATPIGCGDGGPSGDMGFEPDGPPSPHPGNPPPQANSTRSRIHARSRAPSHAKSQRARPGGSGTSRADRVSARSARRRFHALHRAGSSPPSSRPRCCSRRERGPSRSNGRSRRRNKRHPRAK